MNVIVIAAAVGIVAAAALGAAVLVGLAAGPKGPRRFRLKPPGDPEKFIDDDASWAATAQITSSATPEAIWKVLDATAYLARLPFIDGPVPGRSDARETRLTLASVEEHVAHRQPGEDLITVGTGFSVPLAVSACAQRFTIQAEGSQTVVRWTIAVTPKWVGFLPLRWTGFLARPAMKAVLGAIVRAAA